MCAGCAKNNEKETAAETQAVQETQAQQNQSDDTDSQQSAADAQPLTNEAAATFAFNRETLPKMDGSTSMVPLGQAIASVLLGESPEEVGGLINFNRTTQSFRNLMDGYCDLLIVGEPNAAVFDEMKEKHFAYDLEEIATDGLIFVVNKDNPVDNLTTNQIRDIYSGKITNWKEVGGNDAPIIAFQRNEGAGSQALMKKLVMKDTPLTEAPSTLVASEMGELMESVKSYDNSANAIGYSVYYYANDMKKAEGLKLISVDGVEPCAETIRSREYPHLNAYYCVISKLEPKTSSIRALYDWLMSKDGQKLIAAEGYVAAKNPDDLAEELPDGRIVKTDYTYYRKLAIPDNKYTRLEEGFMDKLTASEDYGCIYPYAGSRNFVNDELGYSYETSPLMGFFDEKARLITDPVYSNITPLEYYDDVKEAYITIPFWVMSKIKENPVMDPDSEEYWNNMEQSFASMDGSFVCDKWYWFVAAREDRILCYNEDNSKVDVYDFDGNLVMSSANLKLWDEEGAENYIENFDYGDGIYLIDRKYEEEYFVDESGKILFGPFTYALPFRQGTAVVRKEGETEYGGNLGVMDKNGSWIIEPNYFLITRLRNGNYACDNGNNTQTIFDKDGNFKNRVPGSYIGNENYGFSNHDYEQPLRCYDFDGNLVFEDQSYDWEKVGADGIVYRKDGAGIHLKDIFSGKTMYVEGAEHAHPFYRMEDNPNVPRVIAENSYFDPTNDYFYCHDWVFDNEFNVLYDKKDASLNIIGDELNHEWYVAGYNNVSQVTIYDIDMKEICALPAIPEIVNGKFIITDEYACTAYDKNGEVVFSYTLINSMGD